jgi:hypothetical protein
MFNGRILKVQPDFQQQKSYIQEVIEMLAISAFSFQSSTVNLNLLNISGERSKNISGTTAMELSTY